MLGGDLLLYLQIKGPPLAQWAMGSGEHEDPHRSSGGFSHSLNSEVLLWKGGGRALAVHLQHLWGLRQVSSDGA